MAPLPSPPVLPASQLRLSPLPFVTPLPVDNLPHQSTHPVVLNPGPDNGDSSDTSLSSSFEGDADDSNIEDSEGSYDDQETREDYEISDDEDERNAMAIIRGGPPAAPPAYGQAINDPNIDPMLQSQPAVVPPKETQKKSKKRKDHGMYYR